VKTTLIYNKDNEWQRTTFKPFHTMCQIMKNLTITIE
jgi:hypothetical protein